MRQRDADGEDGAAKEVGIAVDGDKVGEENTRKEDNAGTMGILHLPMQHHEKIGHQAIHTTNKINKKSKENHQIK